MDKVKQYLVKLPFATRNDINNIAGVVALCSMLIIWQRVESAELRVISTIAIAYALLVIMIQLKSPDKKKKVDPIHQERSDSAAKKQTKKASFASKLGTYLIFGLIAGSFFFKDVWLLFMGLGVSFVIGMYETIRKNKLQKILRFYSKVYLRNGFAPYLFGFLSVIFTLTLAFFLSEYSPFPLLHSRWQPFVGVEGNFIAEPVEIAMESSLGMMVGLPLFLLFLAAFPYLAYEEEKLFRYKRTSIGQIIRGAVIFGLAHIVSGIPVFACIALIGSGAVYSIYYKYHFKKYLTEHPHKPKRAAVLALIPATSLHTVHNSIVIFTIFCFYL